MAVTAGPPGERVMVADSRFIVRWLATLTVVVSVCPTLWMAAVGLALLSSPVVVELDRPAPMVWPSVTTSLPLLVIVVYAFAKTLTPLGCKVWVIDREALEMT